MTQADRVLGPVQGHPGGLPSLPLTRPLSSDARISSASAQDELPLFLEPPFPLRNEDNLPLASNLSVLLGKLRWFPEKSSLH